MKPWDARKLLTHLLDGGALETDVIDQILRKPIPEGVHLDYKAWEWFRKKDVATQLRKYVAGFANADGGVLLIGVRETSKDPLVLTPDGDSASVEAREAKDRVTRALTDIAHMLSPPPRTQVVEHQGKVVVAIAVARAPNLVWCVEDRRPVFFLRLEDQTLRAPEYLQADIMTGRRARPVFGIVCADGDLTTFQRLSSSAAVKVVPLAIDNQSLVWADRALLGCVGHLAEGAKQTGPVTSALWQRITVQNMGTTGFAAKSRPRVWMRSVRDLTPFQSIVVPLEITFAQPQSSLAELRWRGVVYLLPENCPPSFWQLEMVGNIDKGPRHTLTKLRDDELGVVSFEVEPGR